MQLDKIIIGLRQRTPWEAMDLGVILIRSMWPVIFLPWLILLFSVLVFTVFLQFNGYWTFAAIFIWWIKPIYESMLLHILSRGIFGEYLSVADVFSSTRQWLRTGVMTSLFWWRLSPSRSFNMPVNLLEGLKGNQRKQRLQVLHRVSGSHAMGITIIGVHFEALLAMTLYMLVFFIAPESSKEYIQMMVTESGDQTWWFIIGSVIYAITLFILEPFYVAAGFMLYLNRRTQLEAWDIELEFRKLSTRLKQHDNPSGQPDHA